MLLVDHVHRVNQLALVLASMSILGVIARMALTFRENVRMLEQTLEEAHTDVLTGLGNRRRLLGDLERMLAGGESKVTLVLFDLNGFKQYNDAFGHPAGDALLEQARRQPRPLHRPARRRLPHGRRRVLRRVRERRRTGRDFVVAGAERALSEQGDGFSISASFGVVTLPDEAGTVSEALGLADQRMYAQKRADRS